MYTETKRSLQRLGFKVSKRFGDRDVILSDGEISIRLVADRNGFEAIYAASTYAASTKENIPVSWHHESRRCDRPGKWVGFNYHIEVIKEEDLDERETAIFYAMAWLPHVGHYTADIDGDIF
jgi:hypothetical protein